MKAISRPRWRRCSFCTTPSPRPRPDACVVAGGLLPQYCPAGTNGSLAFLESFGAAPTVGDIGFGFGMVDYAAIVGDTFAQVVAQTCDDIVPEG